MATITNRPVGAVETQVQSEVARAVPTAIEVGNELAVPTSILRGGFQVSTPSVDVSKVGSYVDTLVPIARQQLPRVLSQSVPENTRVATGTTIDLVLVPVNNIGVNLLDGINADIAASQKMVSDYLPLVTDPQIQAILNKGTDPQAISAADQQTFNAQYQKLTGFTVATDDPTRDFTTTFNSLQGIRSFE